MDVYVKWLCMGYFILICYSIHTEKAKSTKLHKITRLFRMEWLKIIGTFERKNDDYMMLLIWFVHTSRKEFTCRNHVLCMFNKKKTNKYPTFICTSCFFW